MDMEKSYLAGIEPDGLTDIYETKILICYLLRSLERPVTQEQLEHILQDNHLVNYFAFAQAMNELKKTGHILVSEENHAATIHLGALGEETALTLQSTLPLSLREHAVQEAYSFLSREREQKLQEVKLEKTTDGYLISLIIHDIGSDLLNLRLFSADKRQAELIKTQMKRHATEIYQSLFAIISEDPLWLKEILSRIQPDSKE
ncbi:MAG TPA: DUF4364 family protein [Firmicutes bacterium]|nr:DUF4364 family protein [Bacillota bacterium]